ncbi:hypothetical protein GUITHDRAFT_138868 [Guillardia theta CCMP2712]|uniref:Uncharacterized protein n=1 Tax=Guillardia theta (strain CCMP2712) TaxID=905079 RepID=L1JBG2_GUITC|nr:hypothetical protein GUITHDRAFT_138868 [Guillardia theta CCMP2712]EKX45657.1 hypothetical protein GUITHDRAFT_138868 [Guillardia theta CCMP2712]|eukprot:XP_005832637.1 hypothetical protein GUITHDRAFT_138868 [Guillardia theta CCMP2712]
MSSPLGVFMLPACLPACLPGLIFFLLQWKLRAAAWAYGCAFYAVTAARLSHETHLQAFYIKALKLDPKAVGSVWSFYFIWVGACEPVFGAAIDILQSFNVRPSNLLLLVTPAWSLLFYRLWTPDESTRHLYLTLFAFGAVQAFMLMLVTTIFQSFFPPGERRNAASRPRQVLAILGLLTGMVLPPFLSRDWIQTDTLASSLSIAIFAAAMLGSLALSVLEGSVSAGEVTRRSEKTNVLKVASEIASICLHPTFRFVLLFSVLSQLGNALFATSINMYMLYVASMGSPISPALCGVSFLQPVSFFDGCLLPSLSVRWQRTLVPVCFYVACLAAGGKLMQAARDIGAEKTLAREFRIYGSALALTPVTSSAWLHMHGGNGFFVLLLCMLVVGSAGAGLSLLPDLVIAAAVDEDAKAKGRNRSGAFYGAKQFQPNETQQPPQLVAGLTAMCWFVPAVLYHMAAGVTSYYLSLVEHKEKKA